VDVVDEPYKMEYSVRVLKPDAVIRVDFRLGFRISPRINLFFRKVVENMVANHEIDITSRYESLSKQHMIGDFQFVVIEKFLSYDNELPFGEKVIMDIYFFLKSVSLKEGREFGLDSDVVTIEKFPLLLAPPKDFALKRTYE
jgi:KUP system potassium uptake protein